MVTDMVSLLSVRIHFAFTPKVIRVVQILQPRHDVEVELNKEMLKDTSGRTKRDLHPDEEGFIGAWK
jgi:hypothetical protein